MSPDCSVSVRFYAPPEALRRCITTFYLVEFNAPEGARVSDQLHPEWANLRFFSSGDPEGQLPDSSIVSSPRLIVTGPSSRAVPFTVGHTRMWGVGLLPLGWARCVGQPAAGFADAVIDGMQSPAFSRFHALASTLFGSAANPAAEHAQLSSFFMQIGSAPIADEDRIVAIHAAMVNPEIDSVAELVALTGISQRTIERLAKRVFGFPPKLLLRRQRFMRSLSQYMLDPSLKWIGAIDGHYHDQAQFVRDFKRFMGMTPREYAAMEHPILGAMVQARARFAGSAVQTLDGPEGVGA